VSRRARPEPPLGADPAGQKAVELAYRSVSSRERTTAEVRAFLERKEVEPAAIEYALGELTEAGAVDDARFARLFTEDRRGIDGWGRERIERELYRRGIDPDLIEQAAGGTTREDELEAAIDLLRTKLPPAEDDRGRNRAWRLLVRKGYEPELAYDAVRAVASDERAA
jgi:regulatory protein